MNDKRSAWREPMVWLIVALPLASVVAGIALLVTASRSGGSDAIADPVTRTGQVQVADLSPDERARQLGLRAIIRVDKDLLEVLPVGGEFMRDQALRVALHHPTRAAADRTLLLQPTTTGWRIATALDESHDWRVRVTARDGSWRLQGRLPKGQRAALLNPALAHE